MQPNVRAHEALDPALTRKRLLRNTIGCSALAMLVAFSLSGWRAGLSIGLGGALGILNVSWLAASLKAILDTSGGEGQPPQGSPWKFVLRYLVIGVSIFVALQSGWFSLPGILLGLCSFVGAALIEAIYSLFLSYRHADI